MNTRSQSNQKRLTRSTTHPDAIFQELPYKKTRVMIPARPASTLPPTPARSSTPPPTIPATPSAPLKPLRLEHPDTIAPISRNLNNTWETKVPRFVLDPLSSEEWLKNKIKKDNGHYIYICGKPNLNTGRKCTCATHDNIGLYSGCVKHYMWEENLNKYMDF